MVLNTLFSIPLPSFHGDWGSNTFVYSAIWSIALPENMNTIICTVIHSILLVHSNLGPICVEYIQSQCKRIHGILRKNYFHCQSLMKFTIFSFNRLMVALAQSHPRTRCSMIWGWDPWTSDSIALSLSLEILLLAAKRATKLFSEQTSVARWDRERKRSVLRLCDGSRGSFMKKMVFWDLGHMKITKTTKIMKIRRSTKNTKKHENHENHENMKTFPAWKSVKRPWKTAPEHENSVKNVKTEIRFFQDFLIAVS